MSTALRSRRRARTPSLLLVGLVVVAGLMLFPFSALADHTAADYFMFARAEFGKFAETNCDGSNDKQADVSGSTLQIFGRIHSNSDIALSGQTITFNGPLTFGKFDGAAPPCQSQAEPGNIYPSGTPVNLPGNPPNVDGGGWPGNLSNYLDPPTGAQTHPQTFFGPNGVADNGDIEQVLGIGAVCDVGTLTGTSDITLTPANNNQVICNGTGKVQFNISGSQGSPLVRRLTIISHGTIEISGQYVSLSPYKHGILAWTDQLSSVNDVSIKLAGSNFTVPEQSILFSPRSGQDISGSNDSSFCIQVIGQGRLKLAGSNSEFGPQVCNQAPTVVTAIHAGTNHTTDIQNGALAVGTSIHDKVTVTSNSVPPANLTGSITVRRFNNGTCTGASAADQTFTQPADFTAATTVTLENVLAFTPAAGIYSYQATYNGDANNPGPVVGACEGPVRVVDALITITPAVGTNEVGTPHSLTGHVEVNNGTGFANAPSGTLITFTDLGGPGSLSAASCTTLGTTGSCTVTLTSTTAGTDTISASSTVSVSGVSLTRDTDPATLNTPAGPGGSGNATKNWVDARILIDPLLDTNPVGQAHTFTITVEVDTGSGFVAATAGDVSWTISDAGSSFVEDLAASTCDNGQPTLPDNLNASGQCTVVGTSNTAGTTTLNASVSLVVGGLTLVRDTNPSTPTIPAGPGGTGPATKHWAGYRIIVLTCTEDAADTTPLVSSGVDPTNPNLAAANSIGTAPAFAGQTQAALQAYLCGLGGASFNNRPAALHQLNVDVNTPGP